MRDSDPYNNEVRARFENPVHAGDIEGDYAEVLVADVSESAQGARLVLAAGIDAGIIREIRFRAFGCPHLIAAADSICEALVNQPVAGLASVDSNQLAERLSVPVRKTGRLLLIEDAARLLGEKAGI
jgi:NifU-like protein involved in Fe-S cluster formation